MTMGDESCFGTYVVNWEFNEKGWGSWNERDEYERQVDTLASLTIYII
jgi:hypothetical protein